MKIISTLTYEAFVTASIATGDSDKCTAPSMTIGNDVKLVSSWWMAHDDKQSNGSATWESIGCIDIFEFRIVADNSMESWFQQNSITKYTSMIRFFVGETMKQKVFSIFCQVLFCDTNYIYDSNKLHSSGWSFTINIYLSVTGARKQ